MKSFHIFEEEMNAGEETRERTIATTPKKKHGGPQDERAFILFISGALIGKMYLIEKISTIIGRALDADILIKDARISRHHARILMSGKTFFIEDLGSTNGTFVNTERITNQELKNGDKVYLPPDHVFKFAVGDEAERVFQKEMYRLANYDSVTNVPNKYVFIKQLNEVFSFAQNMSWNLGLLMIDIDLFKNVNDSYGHPAGDYILRGVAQRIRKVIRDQDILARYGGDEITVILPGIHTEDAVKVAERIRTSIADNPFRFQGNLIKVTVSIGIAALKNNNIKSVEELIAHADSCLYRSKENGRDCISF